MKHFFTIFLTISFATTLTAQQAPLQNQYFMNRYMLSPAYAGHNANFEVFTGYRKSWLGLSTAPETKFLNANGTVYENSGVGLNIQHDQAGVFQNLDAKATYAHRINITADHQVRVGLSAGLLDSRVDVTGYQESGQNDPVISNNVTMNGTAFDAAIGVAYQYKLWYGGVSADRLLENQVSDKNVFYSLTRHYQAHAGYTYYINKDFALHPLAVLRSSGFSQFHFDVSAQLSYRERYWGTLFYRHNYSAGLQVGGIFLNRVALGYSYEVPMGGIALESMGTHEITLGVVIGNEENSRTSIFQTSPEKDSYYKWVE